MAILFVNISKIITFFLSFIRTNYSTQNFLSIDWEIQRKRKRESEKGTRSYKKYIYRTNLFTRELNPFHRQSQISNRNLAQISLHGKLAKHHTRFSFPIRCRHSSWLWFAKGENDWFTAIFGSVIDCIEREFLKFQCNDCNGGYQCSLWEPIEPPVYVSRKMECILGERWTRSRFQREE